MDWLITGASEQGLIARGIYKNMTMETFCEGILFFGAEKFYEYLKNKNGGKPHFSYQKIVMPVVTLLIASGIFYLIVK